MTVDSTVLIVDDEPEVVETYRETLADTHTVRTAESGNEALDVIDDTVDVVLLDRRMPEMTGDSVLKEVRARDLDCRIVMVTAVDPDTDIIAMDFDEYLVKPVTGEQLRSVVERMLARERLDVKINRMISLGTKLATLEAKLDYEQLQQSEEYNELRREFEQLRESASLDDANDDPYLEAAIENIEALLSNTR